MVLVYHQYEQTLNSKTCFLELEDDGYAVLTTVTLEAAERVAR